MKRIVRKSLAILLLIVVVANSSALSYADNFVMTTIGSQGIDKTNISEENDTTPIVPVEGVETKTAAAGTSAGTGTETGAGIGNKTDAITGTGTEIESGSGTGTGTSTGTETDTETGTGTETGSETGSGTGAGTDTGTESGTGTGTESGTGTEAGTENGADGTTPGIEDPLESVKTITAFTEVTDVTKPLSTLTVIKEQKTTIEAIGLPEQLSVKLEGTEVTETAEQEEVKIDVTWKTKDDSDYENTEYELYTFVPVLGEGYAVAEGLELPYIEVKVGEANPLARAAQTMTEEVWIGYVNEYTAKKTGNWNTYLNGKFYKAASFGVNDNGTPNGYLTWQAVPTDAKVWNGIASTISNTGTILTEQQTLAEENQAVFPAYDESSKTYYVYSCNQLLYALQKIRDDEKNTSVAQVKGTKIIIKKDLNFNGKQGVLWPAGLRIESQIEIDGENHTLYNLYMFNGGESTTPGNAENNYATGLISYAVATSVKNLNIKGANVQGFGSIDDNNKRPVAVLIGYQPAGNFTEQMILSNISLSDCTVVARGDNCGTLIGRLAGSDTRNASTQYIEDCNVRNSLLHGDSHIGSLTGQVALQSTLNTDGTLKANQYINRCYSTGSTVISYAGHSGGLFSCLGCSDIGVANCFADTEVYGTAQTGVLFGLQNGARVAFVNCFTSGFVEGESRLGGFCGELQDGSQAWFMDCYTTALVGLRSSGRELGGFIGYIPDSKSIGVFSNCYAAGEVGAAGTVVANATQGAAHVDANGTPDYIGGFAGQTRSTYTWYRNCYYDKQTTAMREYDLGDKNCLMKQRVVKSPKDFDYYTGDIGMQDGEQGLRGVLTTSTTKSKEGLTADVQGQGNTANALGFTGFARDSDGYRWSKSAKVAGWNSITDKVKYGWDTSTKGHYPELTAFSKNDAGFTGEDATIAAEYSKTSTSTVMLETWDEGLDEDTGELYNANSTASDPKTYDTVRDLTIKFDLTSTAGNAWYRIEKQEGKPGTTANDKGATVTINDKEHDVILLNGAQDTKDYYADQFHPGLEWLEVDYGGAKRKLRVMPTVGIEAGVGETLFRPSDKAPDDTKKKAFYDHADDVELYYSTAARMAVSMKDITTGMYPDTNGNNYTYTYGSTGITGRESNALTENQKNLMPGNTVDELTAYFDENGSVGTNDKYGQVANSGALSYPGIDASYMSRDKTTAVSSLKDNSAKDSKLRVYARVVESINVSNGTFKFPDSNKLLDLTQADIAEGFNGQGFLSPSVTCPYVLLEYIWELADGRIVSDAKILTIRNTPFSAEINTWEAGGLSDTINLVNNINKADDNTGPGRLDTANGLQDTNDTVVNVQKVLGNVNDVELVAKVEDPTDIDTKSGHARENLPYGYGSSSTGTPEAAHEYLWGSYTFPQDGSNNAGQDRPPDTIGPDYMDSLIASWVVNDTGKEVSKIRIRLDSGNVDDQGNKIYFMGEVDPRVSDTITVNYDYYRYVTQNNGTMTIVTEHTERKYKIDSKLLSDGKTVYYLAFNHYDPNAVTSEGYQVLEADVVNNVRVDLELSAKLEFDKTVAGTYGDQTKLFDFILKVTDDTRDGLNKYTYEIWEKKTDANGIVTDEKVTNADGTIAGETVTEGEEKTIQLKHGQSVHVIGLPYNSTYELREDNSGTDKANYIVTVDGAVKQPGEIPEVTSLKKLMVDPLKPNGIPESNAIYTADRRHSFINTYEDVVVTGIQPTDDSSQMTLLVWVVLALLLLGGYLIWLKRRRQNRMYARGHSGRQPIGTHHINMLAGIVGIGLLALLACTEQVQAADGKEVAIHTTVHMVGETPPQVEPVAVTLTGNDALTPMPSDAVGQSKTITALPEETADFGAISYTAAGIYTYTVAQEDMGAAGYTYDTTTYEVTVAVGNDGSIQVVYKNLETGAKVTSLEFWNRYWTQPPDTKVGDLLIRLDVYGSVPTDETFQYTVEFTGAGADETYIYTDADGNILGQIKSGDVIPLKSGQVIIIKDIPVGTNWKVTQSQKPYYTINPLPGMLSGTIVEGLTKAPFEATYDPSKPSPASVDPPVEKQVAGNGAPADSTFHFVLTGDTAHAPMPEGSADGRKELSITGPGRIEMGWITFETTGTFTYTISEVQETLDGYTYDKSIYHMTVTVTEENGRLLAAMHISKENVGETDKILFVNRYDKPGAVKPQDPTKPSNPINDALEHLSNAVKTGDTTTLIPYLMLMFGALFIFIAILLIGRRTKDHWILKEKQSIHKKEK